MNKTIDVASNLIFSNVASLVQPVQINDNQKIKFNAVNSNNLTKYKLVIKKTQSNWWQSYYHLCLDWYYKKFKNHNKFDFNIELNGVDVFAENEISINTNIIEKFVSLKDENILKIDLDDIRRNRYTLEVVELGVIKDAQAPVISVNIESNGATNKNNLPVSISDISGGITTYVWKVMPQAQNGPPLSAGAVNQLIITTTEPQFNIPLTEGLNFFIIQTVDRFNNRSEFTYLNNILLDTKSPLPLVILPAAQETEYTYTLPYSKHIYVRFSENVKSVFINGIAATILNSDNAQVIVPINQAGENLFQITATDMVGNITQFNHVFNVVHVTQFPVLNVTYPISFFTNGNKINLPFSLTSIVPTKTVILVNNIEAFSTNNLSAAPDLYLNEGDNEISIKVYFAVEGFDTSLKASSGFTVVRDSLPPIISSALPKYNDTIFTNQLPLNVPINILFNELITNISVNGISQPTFSNSYNTNYYVAAAGLNTLQLSATDVAGNVAQLSHQINVQYSNAELNLQLSKSSIDVLTNKISTPVSGVASEKLKSITMDGVPIGINADGKTFDSVFNATSDGLYHVVFVGTDIYGNIGTTDTYIRVLSTLPDGIEGYVGPDMTYNSPVYDINVGDVFKGGPGGDICNALDSLFGGTDDIAVQDINLVLKKIPKGYKKKIPFLADVERFYNKHTSRDPSNRAKAGYLMACHGFEILAGEDCQKNRTLFKYMTGQYPEPFIIRKIPGLAPILQNFLIRRYNVCTGLDTSGLGCKDMLVLAPFIADLVAPSTGQLVGSDMGEVVMETLLCKDLCENPLYINTPICQDVELPKIPEVPDFGGPKFGFPGSIDGGSGGSNWGRGGGGNSSWPSDSSGSNCGSWFQPRCAGSGDSGSGGSINYICAAMPSLWLCHPDNPLNSGTVTITPISVCDPNWTISDILNLYPSSASLAYTNYLSSCLVNAAPYIPDNKKPILTVTAPIQNQVVDIETVNVTGFVDDITAKVLVEGVEAVTLIGAGGAYFDVTIAVPSDGKVNIEASDAAGNLADAVEVVLSYVQLGREIPLQDVVGGFWSFNKFSSIGVLSAATSPAGNGAPVAPFLARRIDLNVTTTITEAFFYLRKFRGGGNGIAYFVGNSAGVPNMSDIKSTSAIVNLSLIAENFAPISFLLSPVIVPPGIYWLVVSLPDGIAGEYSGAQVSIGSLDSGATWLTNILGFNLAINYILKGSYESSMITLSVDAFIRKIGTPNFSNKITAFATNLAVGEVLYVTLNSTNISTTLNIVKSDISSIPTGPEIFIIARRTTSNIYISNDLIY